MSDTTELRSTPLAIARYANVGARKAAGETYTPKELADFVADKIVSSASLSSNVAIRVLDPAVGDGALLEALIARVPPANRGQLRIVAYDTNGSAIALAKRKLQEAFPRVSVTFVQGDFLDYVIDKVSQGDLLSTCTSEEKFDLVIANPPYVRTQILGAKQAQVLSKIFGLTGRVDLYYFFLLGISRVLARDGTAGVITSNRFMTTKSGKKVREALLSNFRLIHAWDLGDTKLFDAAVLPAVLLGHGRSATSASNVAKTRLSSIYETSETSAAQAATILGALCQPDGTVVELQDSRRVVVRHGLLDNREDAQGVWRLANDATDEWLARVESNTWATFRRIGKIRVGVKSTADKVFIRDDWDSLPSGRPELLRPLITRKGASRYRATAPAKFGLSKHILYPHESTSRGRQAVDLARYPRTAAYLAQHREALESRTYVIAAGRKWYELWVPHDPELWKQPKLVFPDISDRPVFWLDTEGGVVNGECYWLACEKREEAELLWLSLAIANSSFIEMFYDHRFNNKLYAGRRRFMTQYVEQFPLPNPIKAESRRIVELVKQVHMHTPSSQADKLSLELDTLVWQAFGFTERRSRAGAESGSFG